MICENCKKEISNYSQFCPNCGAKQEKIATTDILEDGNNTDTVLTDGVDVYDEEFQLDCLIETLEVDVYKSSRRKLIIRIASLAVFFIGFLIDIFIAGRFSMILTTAIPWAFWGSLLATYLFGGGIKEFFKKIWNAISAVIAFITVSLLYTIVVIIVLFVIMLVLSIFEAIIPEWIWAVIFICALYSGVVINIINGIKDYNNMKKCEETYLRLKEND